MFTSALLLVSIVSSPSAEAFNPNRTVSFMGRSMTCQQVYDFSEDHSFAAQFQELRGNAVRWRELASEVQRQIDNGHHWSRVNQVLTQLNYAVGAVDSVRSIVMNGAAAGVKAVVMSSVRLPDLTSIQGVLGEFNNRLASANEQTWQELKYRLQSELQTCQSYASSYEQASNEIIQALMDSRYVLQGQCQ